MTTQTISSPLLGEAAAKMLMHLIEGERGSRNYLMQYREAFGYVYEPMIWQWVVFDNRQGNCFVELCDYEYEARRLLIDADDELFAA